MENNETVARQESCRMLVDKKWLWVEYADVCCSGLVSTAHRKVAGTAPCVLDRPGTAALDGRTADGETQGTPPSCIEFSAAPGPSRTAATRNRHPPTPQAGPGPPNFALRLALLPSGLCWILDTFMPPSLLGSYPGRSLHLATG